MTLDAAEAVALRRCALIAEAVNPRLTPRERGRIVREVAGCVHEHPDGSDWVVCRGTVDRWLRAYQQHGLKGLKPLPRCDTGSSAAIPTARAAMTRCAKDTGEETPGGAPPPAFVMHRFRACPVELRWGFVAHRNDPQDRP